ncbi:MAG: hypothetical protein MSR29_08150 [Lachnospiraceae bacterium]|nr:hypothetical protein [Lachnospiraceae bacterium]
MSELLSIMPLPALIIIGLLIVASVILIVYSYIKERTLEQIRGDVYQLVLKAEHRYKQSSAGKQKMKWVVSQARKLLPSWLQIIISEDALVKIIQVWFDEVKDLLDDGKVNKSYR